MPGEDFPLAGVAPYSVRRQIHVGAMAGKVLIMNGAVVEVRLRTTDPATIGKQA